jgi:plasmid stabilization system protein ParE
VVHPTDTEIVRQDGAAQIVALLTELVAEVRRIADAAEGGSAPMESIESRALAMIFAGEKVTTIARTLRIHRDTLYGMPNVRHALQAMRPSAKWGSGPCRGHKTTNGGIEAYED